LDDLNRELPDSVVSADDIEECTSKARRIEYFRLPILEERLIEQQRACDGRCTTTTAPLTKMLTRPFCPARSRKTNDPVRAFPARDGRRAAAHREGEVSIAKRIEPEQIKTQKAIPACRSREELLRMGESRNRSPEHPRHCTSRKQAELTGQEDKADEISGMDHRRHSKTFQKQLPRPVSEWGKASRRTEVTSWQN